MNPVTAYYRAMLFTPYVYGGKSPIHSLDCSGFICEGLKAFGLIRYDETLNAAMLQSRFAEYQRKDGAIGEGDLLYFADSRGRTNHVAYALSRTRMIEAGGGDEDTKDVARAVIQNAMVRERPIKYRMRLCGIQTVPWPEEILTRL